MWKEDVTQLPSLSYLETNCLNHAITCPLLWWILFETFEYFSCLETRGLNHAITLIWWILFETFWYFSMLCTNCLNHAITCFDVYFLKLLNIFSILNTDCLNHAIISWTKHFLNILQTACWLYPMLLSLGIVPLGGWSSGKYGALCYSSVLSVLCGTLLYGGRSVCLIRSAML